MRCSLLILLVVPFAAVAQQSGVVHDKIVCAHRPEQSYALYIPKSESKTPRGLILFFDPGARGRMPVEKYQTVADEYNVILVCSNNSRNGPFGESLAAGEAVLNDVRKRFEVNPDLILASGFSGGARAAVQMALEQSSIRGVVACGAAFPTTNAISRNKPIPFAEVIGRHDMNYQEALKANKFLMSESVPARLIFFAGGHDWPPKEEFGAAIRWHLIRLKQVPAAQITEDQTQRLSSVNANVDAGRYFEALLLFSEIKSDYPTLKTATKLEDESFTKKIKSGLKDFEKATEVETRMQEQFAYAFRAHVANAAPDSAFHEDFWRQILTECKRLQSSSQVEKSNAGARLIDFGWRMCAEQSFVFMGYEQYRQAAMSARIWTILQPENSNAPLQAAKAFAFQKRKRETTEYLKLAIARGVSEEQLKDPVLKDFLPLVKK